MIFFKKVFHILKLLENKYFLTKNFLFSISSLQTPAKWRHKNFIYRSNKKFNNFILWHRTEKRHVISHWNCGFIKGKSPQSHSIQWKYIKKLCKSVSSLIFRKFLLNDHQGLSEQLSSVCLSHSADSIICQIKIELHSLLFRMLMQTSLEAVCHTSLRTEGYCSYHVTMRKADVMFT